MRAAQPQLGPGEVATLQHILQRASGLRLAPELNKLLERSVATAASSMGLEQRAYLSRLFAGERRCVEPLVEACRVGETYFFRNREQLELLATTGLELLGRPESLRVWSAGCSTGEEPYSVAIALREAGRDLSRDLILGTDLSAAALAHAREGRYGEWSFRALPPALRARHFEGPAADTVRAELRARLEWRPHNLVTGPAPAERFHAVLCQNVLIYFAPEVATRVLRELAAALVPGGLLLLSHAELPLASGLELERLELGGTLFFRRPSADAPALPGRPLALLRPTPTPHPMRPVTPPRPELRPAPVVSQKPRSPLESARAAAQAGQLDDAAALVQELLAREPTAEAYLVLAMVCHARGELEQAMAAARRALYLDPALAMGHATLAAVLLRLGRRAESEQARRNALDALAAMDAGAVLEGLESITAGALRRALEVNS